MASTSTAGLASLNCSRELEQVEGIDWLRILYCYPQYLHRRALRRSRRLEKDHPVPRYAPPAHQRPHAQDDEPPAHAKRRARRSSPGCERPSRGWSCAPRSSWVSPEKPRRNSTSSSISSRRPGSSDSAFSPTRSKPTPRRRSSPATCPRRSSSSVVIGSWPPSSRSRSHSIKALVGKNARRLDRRTRAGRPPPVAGPILRRCTRCRRGHLGAGNRAADRRSGQLQDRRRRRVMTWSRRPVAPSSSNRRKARPKPRRRPPPGRLAVIDQP